MAASIRVFPAVIAVSLGVLAFKGADLAYAVVEGEEEATAEQAEADAESEALAATLIGDTGEGEEVSSEESDRAVADAAAQCIPGVDYATEAGISEQEILVLRSLADRREELEARELELQTREQTAAAAEARLEEQITELKALETNVEQQLASMDAKRDKRMDDLVRTYEAMKPKDAARIFDAMKDEDVLIDLAKSMKPANVAAVMSSMDSNRAELVTKRLAQLSEPPKTFEGTSNTEG